MSRLEQTTVTEEDADIRIDRWFKRHFPNVSHAHLQKWLRTGQVRVDGKRVKPGARLEPGQNVRIPPGAFDESVAPKASSSPPVSEADRADLLASVLYRDETVIVINKPPGLAVQGGTKTRRHLDAMLDALRFEANERPRLVHRLDKDTSGVLVLARTRRAATHLTRLFRTRAVRKIYWAVVVGVPKPKSGVIDAALSKRGGRGHEKVDTGDPEGKHAETAYRVLDQAGGMAAWLELEPRTGRTHQLRAHCAEIGTPILGDGKYGGARAFLSGRDIAKALHLHARSLTLPLPGEKELTVTAPLPSGMERTWRGLGFDFDSMPASEE